MAKFRVYCTKTFRYEADVEADDWEEAEEKARYDNDIEWEDHTDYTDNEDYDMDELED